MRKGCYWGGRVYHCGGYHVRPERRGGVASAPCWHNGCWLGRSCSFAVSSPRSGSSRARVMLPVLVRRAASSRGLRGAHGLLRLLPRSGPCEAESGVFARLGSVLRPDRNACGKAGGVFARQAPAPATANHDLPGKVRLERLRVDRAPLRAPTLGR